MWLSNIAVDSTSFRIDVFMVAAGAQGTSYAEDNFNERGDVVSTLKEAGWRVLQERDGACCEETVCPIFCEIADGNQWMAFRGVRRPETFRETCNHRACALATVQLFA